MSIAASQAQLDAPWSLFAPGAQKKAPPSRGSLPPAPDPASRRTAFADVEERRAQLHAPRDQGTKATEPDASARSGYSDDFFGEDGFTFSDFLDIVNPLHHIPVVSSFYRDLTGDEISQGARIAGGTLYGGPIGLSAAIINSELEATTGKDMTNTAMAFLFGDDAGADVPATALASADLVTTDAVPQTADPTAQQLASLSPAAGGLATTPNVAGPLPLFDRQAPIPLAARNSVDQSQAAPGGIAPRGFVTPAPAAVSKPLPAETAHSRPQTFNSGGQPVEPASTTAASAPAPSPTAGPMTLSPAAARRLMEMANQSQAPAPRPVPQEAPATAPSQSAAATSISETGVQDSFGQTPTSDIPSAMLSALQKYEAMKQNPG